MAGVIERVAVLDLTSMHAPEDLARITSIKRVATVLVPESLMPALAAIPMERVASVLPVPDGARVRMHTGVLVVGGEALANPGGENDVLLVTGALVLTSPVRTVGYRRVMVTGAVIAPEGSEAALLAGLTRVTGRVGYYRYAEGQRLRVMQGETRLSGEALSDPGPNAEDALIVAGQLIVTSPVERVGYRQVTVVGQLIAPRESEPVLATAIETIGQVVWYTGTPRIFTGKDRFASGFFELLDGPTSLVLIGKFEIEPDVPPELLRQKVAGIALCGMLTGPRALVPMLQLLTTEKQGTISALEEERGAGGAEPAGDDEP
jgi:hypothetical protein